MNMDTQLQDDNAQAWAQQEQEEEQQIRAMQEECYRVLHLIERNTTEKEMT